MGISQTILERKSINIQALGQNPMIVPVDFSPKSKKAFRDALPLARMMNCKMALFYVLEDASDLEKFIVLEQGSKLREQAYQLMKEWIDDAKDSGVEIFPIVDSGKIYERLKELVKATNAFLVWMASNGSSEKKSRYLGSNALKIIKTAGVPVVTSSLVSSDRPLKKVLLPLDLSIDFEKKVRSLAHFVSGFSKDLVLCVVSIVPDSDEYQINRLSQRLSVLKEILKDASIKYSIEIVKTVSANETLAESVIDYARKMEAGMILITSQQDNNYSQFYLSPLLQEIISISDIPVLTISSKQVSIHA